MSRAEVIYSVSIETRRPVAEALEEILPQEGLDPTWWYDADSDTARVQMFFDDRREAGRRAKDVAKLLSTVRGAASAGVTVSELPREDWAESWKKFFHTERVSRRIVVKPSWEKFRPRRGDCVVEIDPGMSFGTGQHGTTRACLQMLDDLRRETSAGAVLDVGCGSGILAIAAAKLGFAPVVAFDNDPEAVHTARINARQNGVGDAADFFAADIATFVSSVKYDVVVANLLGALLIRHAKALVRAALPGPGGGLILSGMLTPEYPAVARVFRSLGCREKARATLDQWTTGCFECPRRPRQGVRSRPGADRP
jgi:ribosomal protein L11 methyltransferase